MKKKKPGRMNGKRGIFAIFLLSGLFFALISFPSFAHKVNIFAYAEGDTVYTESYFPDGTKVQGGTVEVYDSEGNKLLEGKTDEEGRFNFKLPKKTDLKIVLIATMGHRASYLLSKDELPETASVQEQISEKPQFAERPVTVEETQLKEAHVDLNQLKTVIDKSLDEKLRPLMREIVKMQQEKVSFTEIIGGIGYIFGITGIIFYFASKKRN